MALYFVQFVSFLHEWFFELFGLLVQEAGLVVGLAAKPGKCSIGGPMYWVRMPMS